MREGMSNLLSTVDDFHENQHQDDERDHTADDDDGRDVGILQDEDVTWIHNNNVFMHSLTKLLWLKNI